MTALSEAEKLGAEAHFADLDCSVSVRTTTMETIRLISWAYSCAAPSLAIIIKTHSRVEAMTFSSPLCSGMGHS